jgi:hypothetical protein
MVQQVSSNGNVTFSNIDQYIAYTDFSIPRSKSRDSVTNQDTMEVLHSHSNNLLSSCHATV